MNTHRLFIACLLGLFLAGCNSALQLYKKGERRSKAGEYQVALDLYQKSLAKNPNFAPAQVNSSVAAAYRLSNRIKEAAPFYQAAIAAGNKEDSVMFYYGYALKAQGKYKEAAAQFEQYLKSTRNVHRKNLAKREIENLPLIEQMAGEKTFYEIGNVSALNTTAAEFSPVVQNEEFIFTSSRKNMVYKANGLGMLGLYKSRFSGDSIQGNSIELFSDQLNVSNVNEGTPTFSKDGKTMIFARGNVGGRVKVNKPTDVNLYISRFKNGQWSEPEMLPLSKQEKQEAWDGAPALSTDGKTLYFASNREGGLGGLDIWQATADGSGRFGRVRNMGSSINTPGNEIFPYVSDDGRLFFSSDGHPGLGGLDLFVATRSAGEVAVRNMGIPLNSTADDFGIIFKSSVAGYFSSNREGGAGDDDIYYFEDKKPDYKIVNYYLAGKTVTRGGGQEAALGSTKIRIMEGDKQVSETTTGPDGTFKIKVKESQNYTIIAEKPEYLIRREFFSMSGKSIPQEQLVKPVTDTTYNITIPLEKPELNKVFVVENIYYDLDKDNIRPDAAEELDKLVDFLKDNQNISVELGSHTDARATDTYNQDLSQRRAESAVRYLIENGIEKTRIIAKGYGETQLIEKEAQSEEEHQRNRRTEIKITGIR